MVEPVENGARLATDVITISDGWASESTKDALTADFRVLDHVTTARGGPPR